jgi:hypothetical protein
MNALAGGNLMRRRASSFGPVRSGLAGLLLATIAVGLDSPAQAECILQPNQQAPEGAHWSLHLDHTTNRRCWVLMDGAGREISATPEPAAPVAVSPIQSFLDTFNFIGGPPAAAAPPQEPPAAAPVVPPRRPPPRVATATKPAAGHEMTPEERDALFEEFLRWHESQQMTGTAKDQPR